MRPDMEKLKGKSPERQLLFLQEWLVREFTEQLAEAIEQKKVSQAELAEKADVSQPYISKVMKGENVTLRNAAKLAWSLGYFVDLSFVPVWKASADLNTDRFQTTAARAHLAQGDAHPDDNIDGLAA